MRALWALALCALIGTGCRDRQMYTQPKATTLNGMYIHVPPDHTVSSVSEPMESPSAFPLPVTRALLERGQERYAIYCTPCHGVLGDGRGMVVQRGFPAPPSFQTLDKSAPQIFTIISNGTDKMPAYADRVPVSDRWAIISYIRALQRSGQP